MYLLHVPYHFPLAYCSYQRNSESNVIFPIPGCPKDNAIVKVMLSYPVLCVQTMNAILKVMLPFPFLDAQTVNTQLNNTLTSGRLKILRNANDFDSFTGHVFNYATNVLSFEVERYKIIV